MLSKFTLKYIVYCQVFWVEVWGFQDKCISKWALVFCCYISNNLPNEKTVIQSNNINKTFPNMFSKKIKKIFHKKVKVKKYLLLLFHLFLIFRFSFSFLSCFFSASCYVKQFLGGLHLFRDLLFVFKESNLRYLKKIRVKIIVFNKKAVVKISGIFNSKSPP